MQIEINGQVQEVDLSLDNLSLKESVALERLLGDEGWDRLARGELRPSTIQALVYVKLQRQFPELGLDDFDIAMSEALGGDEADDSPNA